MSAPSGSSPRAWLAAILVAGACTGRPAGVSPSDRPATTMAPSSVPRVGEIRTGTVGGESTSADTAPRVSCRSHCRAGRPPLYVIDGAVVGRSTPPTLDRSLIDTVILLRGPEEVRRYGASGTDGVVEIRMLRPDSTDLGLVPADQPLSAAQAATVCGRAAGHAPIAVIDGRILTGDAKIEAS